MRTKTIMYCDGLDPDGNPCPSHFERETSVHGGGVIGRSGLPPGWWNVSLTKELAPRERRATPNFIESPAMQMMIEAIGKAVTPPDKERAAELEQILERIRSAAGDSGNHAITSAINADVAVATMLVSQLISTPEKIEVQMKQMVDEMRKAYSTLDSQLPAPRPRVIGIRATLCDKHPQPGVQFDESKVPEWAGVSVCHPCDDHLGVADDDYVQIDGLPLEPLGGAVQVATPVGHGG